MLHIARQANYFSARTHKNEFDDSNTERGKMAVMLLEIMVFLKNHHTHHISACPSTSSVVSVKTSRSPAEPSIQQPDFERTNLDEQPMKERQKKKPTKKIYIPHTYLSSKMGVRKLFQLLIPAPLSISAAQIVDNGPFQLRISSNVNASINGT